MAIEHFTEEGKSDYWDRIEANKISFDDKISINRVETFLEYLAKEVPVSIRYAINQSGKLLYVGKNGLNRGNGAIDISARIFERDGISLELISYGGQSGFIQGFVFTDGLNEDPRAKSPKVQSLWQKIRENTDKYLRTKTY